MHVEAIWTVTFFGQEVIVLCNGGKVLLNGGFVIL